MKIVNQAQNKVPPIREVNKAELAEAFEVSLPTVDNWVRRKCPILQKGSRGTPWAFDLFAVYAWRHNLESSQDEVYDADPESMNPKDRLDWYRGCREKDAHEQARNLLIPFDLSEAVISSAFSEVRAGLLSQHSIIAAEHPEIPTDAIRRIQRANKDLLKRLSETRLPDTIAGALDALDAST